MDPAGADEEWAEGLLLVAVQEELGLRSWGRQAMTRGLDERQRSSFVAVRQYAVAWICGLHVWELQHWPCWENCLTVLGRSDALPLRQVFPNGLLFICSWVRWACSTTAASISQAFLIYFEWLAVGGKMAVLFECGGFFFFCEIWCPWQYWLVANSHFLCWTS